MINPIKDFFHIGIYTYVIVDLFSLNPCWLFYNNLIHKDVILLFTFFENNLDIIDDLEFRYGTIIIY